MALLTVGIASSALFDLSQSQRVFDEQGVDAYREYQLAHLDEPLPPGPAQPFIAQLLKLNDVVADAADVIVMSRNSPETGMRVMRSIKAAGLPITRAVFRNGQPSYEFMPALGMSLFLSANLDDVRQAVDDGYPAGAVIHGDPDQDQDSGLRVAFDFDGVLADDSAERVFQTEGLGRYSHHEQSLANEPLPQGPLAPFLAGLNQIQRAEIEVAKKDPHYERQLRIALLTARSAPAHERAINSLASWGLTVDDAFFLGGMPKAPVLDVLRPHIFFDDQLRHLVNAPRTPSVHVPFGICNEPTPIHQVHSPRRALLEETA